MSFETQLRQALAAEAATVQPAEAHPYQRVSAAVTKERRRRRVTAVAGLAVAAVLAISVPLAANRLGDGKGTTLPADRSSVPVASDPLWDRISTWPLRGNLAGDEQLAADVGKRFGGRPVLLADLGQRRFALVMSEARMVFAVAQRGDPAERFVHTNGEQLGFTDSGDIVVRGASQLFIATTPDVKSAEVSRTPTIGLDGSVTRTWERLPLTDGIGTAPASPLTTLRVGTTGPPQWFSLGEDDPPPNQLACPAPCSDEAWAGLRVKEIDASAAWHFGLTPEEVTTRTIHLGVVPTEVAKEALSPGLIGSHTVMHVVVTTLPDGQALRTVEVAHLHQSRGSVVIAGSPELFRPVAVDRVGLTPVLVYRSDTGPDADLNAWIVSPGGAAVRATSDDPDRWPSSERLDLVDGGVRLRLNVTPADFEAHYSLKVLDDRGSVMGTFPTTSSNPLFE